MAHIISAINMKGGVGKTTLCIGIGEYIAHYLNKKVLFIDLDPQFNTTQSLMNMYDQEEEYLNNYVKNDITVKRLFARPTSIAERPETPKIDDVIVKLDEYVSIIPGTINLIFEEDKKSSSSSKKVKRFIKDNNLRSEYDYIFIDCPPTISLYTDSALIASDYYLVPIKVDRYSILGVKLLDNVIERLIYEESLDIKPLGIIYTMLERTLTEKTTDIMTEFEKDEIVTRYGIFDSSTHFVRDLLVGKQGNISSRYDVSRNDIELVAKEMIRRLESGD